MKKWMVVLVCLLSPISFAGWVRQTSNTTLTLNDVCFVDSLYGWAVGGYYAWPDTTAWVVLRTTDGGNNWINAWQTSGVGVLETVTFINRLHGWALADSAIFLESTDGGVSWHYQPSPGPRIYFLAERFVNDTLGYMLYYIPDFMGIMDGSNVAWTTDGGGLGIKEYPELNNRYIFWALMSTARIGPGL